MLFLSLSLTPLHADSDNTVTLHFKNETLKVVLNEIAKQSNMKIFFSDGDVKSTTSVSIQGSFALSEALQKALKDSELIYELHKGSIIIKRQRIKPKLVSPALQQEKTTLSGTVKNAQGDGIPGVNIMIKGTTQGTVTDVNGNFTLKTNTDDILVISFVGHKTQETIIGNRQRIDIILEEDLAELETVVVVGYGEQKKVNLTGSVASVNLEKVDSRAVPNVASALSGLAPGLNVSTAKGGSVGDESISIRVRGNTTLSGINTPLIIVDGLETSMSDIDPNDIASIAILKDASSAAIYGAKAAAGVILVTTKRGKTGRMKMKYNAYAGWQKSFTAPDYVSDFAVWMEKANTFYNQEMFPVEDIQEWRDSDNPLTHPNTDWYDEQVGGSAFIQNHNFSFSGGSASTRYRMSLSYLNQQGLLEGNEQDRYSIRTNVETDLNQILSVGGNLSLVWKDLTPNIYGGGLRLENSAPGVSSVKGPDGYWAGGQHSSLGGVRNILAEAENEFRNSRRQRIVSDVFVRLKPIKGLTLEAKVALNYNNSLYRSFSKRYFEKNYREDVLSHPKNDLREASTQHSQSYRLVNFETATYKRSIEGHNIKAMLGHQAEQYRFDDIGGSLKGFPSNEIYVLDAGSVDPSVNGGITDNSMESFFGRLNYDYKGRYLVEGNLRLDKSSRFAEHNRDATFPSVSAGWRISEENFLSGWKALDNLKLRASWGRLGNDRIGSYPYQDTYSINKNYTFGEQIYPGYASTQFMDPDIQWETTEISSVAMETRLFKTLDLSAEYFHKNTTGILRSLPLPNFLGAKGDPVINLAELVNEGLEFSLSYSGKVGDLEYSLGGNLTWIKNEVTKLSEHVQKGALQVGENSSSYYIYESVGIFRSQEQLDNAATHRPFTDLGDIEYKDQITEDTDGDGIPDAGNGIIDGDDRIIAGKSAPTYNYGANLSLRYKNFDFSMLIQGVSDVEGTWLGGGNKPFVNIGRGALHSMWLDAYDKTENPEGQWPRLFDESNGMNEYSSTFWIRDMSYLRVKNVQLGYKLPKTVTQRLGINNTRLYLSADNLFTVSDYFSELGLDPETRSSTSVPNVSTFIIGLNVQF
ncbi:TonB-dependent receptor [Fulvitalea axinellae]